MCRKVKEVLKKILLNPTFSNAVAEIFNLVKNGEPRSEVMK